MEYIDRTGQLVSLSTEEMLAKLERRLQDQNELLSRQSALLEKQRRWMRLGVIWACVKVALVVLLVLCFGPKVCGAWQQYQQLMVQVQDLTEQVNAFLPELEALSVQVEEFLVNVQARLDTVAQTMETLQSAFAPVAQFMARFG